MYEENVDFVTTFRDYVDPVLQYRLSMELYTSPKYKWHIDLEKPQRSCYIYNTGEGTCSVVTKAIILWNVKHGLSPAARVG